MLRDAHGFAWLGVGVNKRFDSLGLREISSSGLPPRQDLLWPMPEAQDLVPADASRGQERTNDVVQLLRPFVPPEPWGQWLRLLRPRMTMGRI